MATGKKRTTMSPSVFSKPQEIVNVQLRHKQRDKDGKLVSKGQKAFSVQNIGLQELFDLLMKALEKRE